MKIGILTYHRAHNFGAVLQCYALKTVLSNFGHEVQVIDYRQPTIEAVYQYKASFNLRSFLREPIVEMNIYIKGLFYQHKKNYNKRKEIFESFCKNYLNLSSQCGSNIQDIYDLYVIGSDMLWGAECMMGKFDPVYFGAFPHLKEHPVIGYAISSTPYSIERLGKETNFEFLSGFKALSLREYRLASMVEQYTKRSIPVCLDPTLLTDNDIWSPLINQLWAERKYILTYFIRLPKEDRKVISTKLKKFVSEGYEIINIDLGLSSEPIRVEDFISMIKYAGYLVTDSFHGVVFSTIFHTPVHAVCLYDHGDVRYTNLLESLGLRDLLVERHFKPFIPDICFLDSDKRLSELQKSSMDFLATNICI